MGDSDIIGHVTPEKCIQPVTVHITSKAQNHLTTTPRVVERFDKVDCMGSNGAVMTVS